MARAPVGQIRRPLRLAPRRRQDAVLALVPVHGRLVHVVPRELVEQEQRRQPGQLVEGRPKRMDVMQDSSGDDGIEGHGLIQLLQSHAAVRRAGGSVRIDGEDVVPDGE